MRGKGLEEDAGTTSAGDCRGRRRVYFVRIDRTGDERVLLIDDEGALAKVGGIMPEHLGYRVTVKTGSAEALAAFKEAPGEF